MPFLFFVALAVAILAIFRAFLARGQGWGIPAICVISTATIWYLGDPLYNSYEIYNAMFGDNHIQAAWLQVVIFLVTFNVATPLLHRSINRNLAEKRSFAIRCYEENLLDSTRIQKRIDQVTPALFALWAVLMLIAILRVDLKLLPLFAPYLTGYKLDPWARGRLGGGVDAILVFASYLQSFLTAAFGVILAISRNPKTRRTAFLVCLLAFPYYIFDRTRYLIVITILPGFLAWVLLRLKQQLWVKIVMLVVGFLIVNFWFTFIMAGRSAQTGISQAFKDGVDEEVLEDTRHLGFNMFEELLWVNSLIDSGRYEINWGERYFAELVNPVPRVVWKNKPMVGLDYAIARGQVRQGGNQMVTATISTGLIGQGVTNFGKILGPIAAAFLMSLWAIILARQDLMANTDPARLLLFAVGLLITFPMGRDMTLLVLYPFIFGVGLLWLWNKYNRNRNPN